MGDDIRFASIEDASDPNATWEDEHERCTDDVDADDEDTLFSNPQSNCEADVEEDAATVVDEMSSSEDFEPESDHDDDDDEDEEYVDESDGEEIIPDYPHVGPQRQSSQRSQVFYFKSTHQMSLTDEGIEQLRSTEAGRAALQNQQSEGANVQLRRRDVPLQYRSPNVVQPLIDNSETSFYPIVAKDDQVYLKIDTTILFPGRSNHRKPSPAEVRCSGLNIAIKGFFEQVHSASAFLLPV